MSPGPVGVGVKQDKRLKRHAAPGFAVLFLQGKEARGKRGRLKAAGATRERFPPGARRYEAGTGEERDCEGEESVRSRGKREAEMERRWRGLGETLG